MNRTHIGRATVFLALAIVTFVPACRRSTPLELRTPAQRVAVYNGVLAESVRAATEAAIGLERSGVLTRPQVLQVLDYTERVAHSSKAVAVIQQTPGDWTVLAPQIRTVLNSISPPGDFARWLGGTPEAAKASSASLDALQATVAIMIREVSK
ncbi:MAG: hypothetical protein EHM65_02500 [Acidobacteriales bacterium]|nr:MAG: hypothetical protein EHM65_02500 [Terriglobales bacterium]